ncbi:hypothetical protein N3K66_003383 [Trichothecium roseum]|uniref:Uncharacterized protein n=1 Tax=Trichothecium roseum TaxID=47278 RepID=A0ACC0V6K7_9HYPO|nr:hypothetical protein N3K66_003383 [Trichothecium roseum]
MASQASLKELTKAVSAFIVSPTLAIPEDLIDTIEAYLRKHPKYDEATADRLQEELYALFEKHVRPNTYAAGAWIAILRRLLPMIHTPERVIFWMDSFKGMLTRQVYDKGVVDETTALLTDLVGLANEYSDQSEAEEEMNPIIQRIFVAWMERFYPATVEGLPGMEYNERMFRDGLIQFAKKRPKQFFASLNSFFVQKAHRKAALRFLCDYIQARPPHVYQVVEAPLFGNLLVCLQQDTSTAIISAALTALVMLLPNMPSSLVPYLPTLFNIYARILFWGQDKTQIQDILHLDLGKSTQWEVCHYVEGVENASVTHLSSYYTILYGLYPINFMDYIRKPQRYLRHANVANADDVEVQPTEIRQQSEQFRQRHFLHPNFYTLTIDSEKTDFGRFIKSEPSEVVAECMALCLSPESEFGTTVDAPATTIVQSPAAESEGEGILSMGSLANEPQNSSYSDNHAMRIGSLSQNLRKQSSYSSLTSHGVLTRVKSHESTPAEGTASPPHLPSSSSHTQLQDMIQSNKVIKSGLAQTIRRNDSEASLSLSHQDGPAERPPPSHDQASILSINNGTTQADKSLAEKAAADKDPQVQTQIAYLQRQNLMIQNDLSFERYQKQQHMAHIADLRRKQVTEAATEAETQKIILMNRNLKSRAEEAKNAEMQARKEAEKSRSLAKNWEATLSNKLKKLREELEKTDSELRQVKGELAASQEETDKLRKLICVAEVKELNWKQNAQFVELHTAEFDRLKSDVERLTISERDSQAKERERELQMESTAEAEAKTEEMRMKLASKELEMEQMRKVFASQLDVIRAELAQAQTDNRRPRTNFGGDIEGALSGSRAKQAELQKQYDLLKRKYTSLQSSVLDMESGNTPEQIRMDATSQAYPGQHAPAAQQTDDSIYPDELNMYDKLTSGQHVSGLPPPPPSTLPPRSSGGDTVASGSSNHTSTTMDHRYFGRVVGGAQKKVKDKHKDDDQGSISGKKKKSGLRGIRGLV